MTKKHTYQYIKSYIESYNYKLLSEEYNNSSTMLMIKCPEDHIFEMKYNNFKSGQRCPTCAKENYG